MSPYAELELHVRREPDGDYTVDLRFRQADDSADSYMQGGPARIRLYPEALREHSTSPLAYGEQLSAMFFADQRLSAAFAQKCAMAEGAGSNLRLILRLDANDAELHSLRWETLIDPRTKGSFLATSQRLLFSRYLDSADLTRIVRRPKDRLKALVAVANPQGLQRYGLQPVDFRAEIDRARAALAGVEISVRSFGDNGKPASLNNIAAELGRGQDIFYLVCHGSLPVGKPILFLERDGPREEGKESVDRVDGASLVKRIADLQQRPTLVVLASCESAGTGVSEGVLSAIGPQLAGAGVAAVIAMQGKVAMQTVERMMPVFFSELQEDGQIDRAMAAARAAVCAAAQQQPDWWMPGLFLRVRDGQLWKTKGGDEGTITLVEEQAYNVEAIKSPYLGLSSYGYDDKDSYAGREKAVEHALAILSSPGEQRPLLFVTGSSGSGKSSFVLAGLLPALEARYAKLHMQVCHASFRPSRLPLAGLREALQQLKLPAHSLELSPASATAEALGAFLRDHTPINQVNLLVIDQFEELFTQSDQDERDTLFALLPGLPPYMASRTHVIATVRSDYLPELFNHPALYDIVRQSISLRAMDPDELREAIRRPLQRRCPSGDKRFEDGLLDQLVEDTLREGDSALPLLQMALDDLWKRGRLRLSAYDQDAGLARPLSQHADQVLNFDQNQKQRPPSDQELIRAILIDLVKASEDGNAQHDVRQRRSFAELTNGDPDRERLINALVSGRLLASSHDESTGEDMVDLVHEALLRSWKWLKDEIDKQRQHLRQQARFIQHLNEWLAHKHQEEEEQAKYLLDGLRLSEAESLAASGNVVFRNADAQQFLKQSLDRRQSEQQKRRIAVVTPSLVGQAFYQYTRRKSVQQATLLARQAYLFYQRVPGRSLSQIDDVLRIILQEMSLARPLAGHQRAVQAVAFSPNGRTLASAGDDVVIRLRDLGEPDLISHELWGHEGAVTALAFSPDGRILASASQDNSIRLWDPRRPVPLLHALTGHEREVTALAFSSNGHILVSSSNDRTIRLWDMQRGGAQLRVLHEDDQIHTVAFSADGRTLASPYFSQIQLWDLDRSDPRLGTLEGHAHGVQSLAFSPDGQTLASSDGNYTIRLWRPHQSDAPLRELTGHTSTVHALVFSRDGQTLVSGSSDGSIRVWDLRQPDANPCILTQDGIGSISSLALSPDGLSFATGGESLMLWRTTERLAQLACTQVERNLTMAEWHEFIGQGILYERTCPNLPVDPSVLSYARAQAGAGETEAAIATFRHILQIDPGQNLQPEIEAYALAALGLAQSYDAQGALANLERLRAIDPAHDLREIVDALREAGYEQAHRGDTASAIAALTYVREFDRDQSLDPEVEAYERAFLGKAKVADIPAMLAYLGHLREVAPHYDLHRIALPVLLGVGQGQASEGNLDTALELFAHVHEIDPAQSFDPKAEAYTHMSRGLAIAGDISSAITYLQQAHIAEPGRDLSEPLALLREAGNTRARAGDAEGAILAFRCIQELEPGQNLNPEAEAAALAAQALAEQSAASEAQG